MGSRRSLSWSAALRDLKDDRAERPDVREERLRPGPDGQPMSAWRGVSSRRYVVKVHPVDDARVGRAASVVWLAVGRNEQGAASIVSTACDLEPGEFARWRADVEAGGATEVHVHSLADSSEERARIAFDVWGEPPGDGASGVGEGVRR